MIGAFISDAFLNHELTDCQSIHKFNKKNPDFHQLFWISIEQQA